MVGGEAMVLGDDEKLCDEGVDVEGLWLWFDVGGLWMVPYFPLVVVVDWNHFFFGHEYSEDVDEYFKSYQHFFEKMHALWER